MNILYTIFQIVFARVEEFARHLTKTARFGTHRSPTFVNL